MHFCGVAASRSLPSPLVGEGAGAERRRVRGRAASSELVEASHRTPPRRSSRLSGQCLSWVWGQGDSQRPQGLRSPLSHGWRRLPSAQIHDRPVWARLTGRLVEAGMTLVAEA